MSEAANPSPILSYSSDGQRPASFLFYYAMFLLIAMVPTALLLGYFLLLVPHYKEIFKDFRTTLPALTEWTIWLANGVSDGLWIPILVAWLALPALPAWGTVRQTVGAGRSRAILIGIIVMLAFVLIGVIVGAVAIYLPLVRLIHSVSGGP